MVSRTTYNTGMSNIRIDIIDTASVAIFRQKTEAERLQIAWAMWRSARGMLLNLMRSEHPDWSDASQP